MSEVTLFGQKRSELAVKLKNNLTDKLAGGAGGATNRRISIKGGVFREMINGKEYRVNEDRAINLVIVDAAPISRMYYAGSYVEGEAVKPVCWSSNGQAPDQNVPQDQRQASRCMDCKQNIKGSGQGEGRACRFQQRVAVMLEGDIESREVYQLPLPPTSIFGEGEKNKLPMQAYGRFLRAHNTNPSEIVTEARFDTSSPTPKLVFRAVRPLNDDEMAIVAEMQEHPDTARAVTLTVSQMDKVEDKPATKAALFAPEPKAAPAKVEAVEEEVEQPKKIVKKQAVVEPKSDLADLVDNWDD